MLADLDPGRPRSRWRRSCDRQQTHSRPTATSACRPNALG